MKRVFVMKESQIFSHIFLLMALSTFLYSCKGVCYLSVDKQIYENNKLINNVLNYLYPIKKEHVDIVKIVWNDECSCGLIDVRRVKREPTFFMPVLVSNDSLITFTYGNKNKFVTKEEKQLKLDNFLKRNKIYFSKNEIALINERLRFNKINFGSSLITCELDLERDSILLSIYLDSKNDTLIKKQCNIQ